MTKTHFVSLFATGLIMLLGSACSSVTTTHPLPRMESYPDQEKLEGNWSDGDQIIHLKFDEKGVIHFAGVSWQETAFRLERGEATVCDGAEHDLFSVRIQENGEWLDGYVFAQFHLTDRGFLVLWLPDVDVFADAIDEGLLEGVVERGKYGTDVSITGPPETLHAFLNDPEKGPLFDYDDPMILRRLE